MPMMINIRAQDSQGIFYEAKLVAEPDGSPLDVVEDTIRDLGYDVTRVAVEASSGLIPLQYGDMVQVYNQDSEGTPIFEGKAIITGAKDPEENRYFVRFPDETVSYERVIEPDGQNVDPEHYIAEELAKRSLRRALDAS